MPQWNKLWPVFHDIGSICTTSCDCLECGQLWLRARGRRVTTPPISTQSQAPSPRNHHPPGQIRLAHFLCHYRDHRRAQELWSGTVYMHAIHTMGNNSPPFKVCKQKLLAISHYSCFLGLDLVLVFSAHLANPPLPLGCVHLWSIPKYVMKT